MTDSLADHWSQHRPGPLTAAQRDRRITRLTTERDREVARLEAWVTAAQTELTRTHDFFDAAIAREQRRPLRKDQP